MLEYNMKAGTYFVGDLFNILHNQWDDVYDSTGTYIEGKSILPDGTEYILFDTEESYGVFTDQMGNRYDTDTGSIGIVKIDPHDFPYLKNLGLIHDFEDSFIVEKSDSVIRVGDFYIDTMVSLDLLEEDILVDEP